MDVRDGLFQSIDDFYGQNQISVFGFPILF